MTLSPIEEIKSRLDIVDVISSYIKLKRTGSNYKAICPFHSEKNPSFFVSPARQIWHCFGCGAGGGIFDFVMRIEGIEFGDALKILAQKAGVELKPKSPEWQKLKTERQRLYEILELATKFFEKQLEGKVGQKVVEYLKKRGISEESIKKWRIGWAPQSWDSLIKLLVSKGYKKEEIEKAGLAIKSGTENYYDRFRGRIIFPIFDLNSQVVGFGGRIFGKKEKEAEVAKYINTPSTLLYDKGKILYGLDKAKLEIRRKDFCILVEGYTDVILAHQAGFENTVATSGTALGSYQLSILKRYTDNLYLAFDMDIAGDFATKRGIDLAQIQGFNIKVMVLPEGKDPADVISSDHKKFESVILEARSILDFYFENAFLKFDKTNLEGKKEILKILLPVIKRIQNLVEQSHWISKLAEELSAKEDDIRMEMEKLKLEEEKFGLEPEELIKTPTKSKKELLEENLLVLILKSPEHLKLISPEMLEFFSTATREILTNLQKDLKINLENLSSEIREYFQIISLKAEIEEIEKEKILPEIEFCLKEIQKITLKDKLSQISEEIRKAEKEKDEEKVKKLTEEFSLLSRKLSKI